MSVLIAVIVATVIILVGALRPRRARQRQPEVLIRRYYHPGHSWLRLTEDEDVLVGIDDLAQSVLGSVDEVMLPRLLKFVRQGEVGWKIRHGDRVVPVVSPVTGWVTQKNEAVLSAPRLVNASPYGDGWILRVRPSKLPGQLRNLFSGRQAHQWLDGVRANLIRLFTGAPALMYQDGGVILDNLCDRASDEEWNAVLHEFFLVNEDDIQFHMERKQ